MEIVINSCFGGFSLSYEAVMLYGKYAGIKIYASIDNPEDRTLSFKNRTYISYEGKSTKEPFIIFYNTRPLKNGKPLEKTWFSERDISRTDPNLIKVVKELGDKADGRCADLKVIEIPDDIEYIIDEYDGNETVEEKHRSWS